ncbi:MAG: IS110 family transposase [Desulfotomaculales bacterium]
MTKRNKNLKEIRSVPTLIVGIDIAKRTHWARTLDGSTGIEVGSAFSFQNSINGFSRLLGRMHRVKEQIGAKNIVVAMEPSGHYWKPLASYLVDTGIPVVIVNPYHVKKAKGTRR